MRCEHCGAEINLKIGKCEFCGSQISLEMRKEQEQLNKQGCPRCNSTNISFSREKQGEVRGKNVTSVVINTVGFCQDCGNTWKVENPTQRKKQNNMLLWILGWIFIFPVPVTILVLRKKDLEMGPKYGMIAAAWLAYIILLAINGGSSDSTSNNPPVEVSSEVKQDDSKEQSTDVVTEQEEQPIDDKDKDDSSKDDKSKKKEKKDKKDKKDKNKEEEKEPELTVGQLNAIRKAESYLEFMPFSKKGLIDQLVFDGFTKKEAKFAVNNIEVNWKEQAALKAQSYIDMMSFSKQGLIDQLVFDGFTKKQAKYGAKAVGY